MRSKNVSDSPPRSAYESYLKGIIMSQLEKLQKCTTISDLASLLGYKPNSLTFILYQIPDDEKYKDFEIKKRNGKTRNISAPVSRLKELQKHLADLLYSCSKEINRNKTNVKKLSHGFEKNQSIITNAKNHTNRRYVFNIDLKDFFPTINFGRIQGYFIKDNNFKLQKNIATIIAQIACKDGTLPQGSPCSPILSNLITNLLDIRLVRLSKKYKCTYSRYADDITFSTNNKNFPTSIAQLDKEQWAIGNRLKKEIKNSGFEINYEKVRMIFKDKRQTVTGLVTNSHVNVSSDYYRYLRSICHSLFKNGKATIPESFLNKNENEELSLNQIQGYLSHVYNVKKIKLEKNNNRSRYSPVGIVKLYKRFLFYKHFIANDKPLILTEGKTDIVYLRSALKKLSPKYPDLVTKDDKEYNFNLHFLNFTKTFKEIFDIASGTSGLAAIIQIYKNEFNYFVSQSKPKPVIIIIDNDKGSHDILKKIKYIKNDKKINPGGLIHLFHNLFVLYVSDKPNTEIEELFTKTVLETKVDGKIFTRNENFNTDKYYGKQVFADKVIRPNYKEIDFSNFVKTLDRIRESISLNKESS